MLKRLLTLGGLASFAILAAACGEDPVSPPPPPPPPDPVRVALIDTVRLLADQRNLDPVPGSGPVRPELVKLGRALLFDRELSGNRNIACSTCHLPSFATTDGKSLSVGEGGAGLGPSRTHPGGVFIPRNAPALFNMHLQTQFFWDGRVEDLDDGSIRTPAGTQVTPAMEAIFEFGAISALGMFPVTSRDEMRGELGEPGNELGAVADGDFQGIWSALMDRLGAFTAYRTLFEAAYPGTAFDDMTFAHASNAMAGFMISELAFVDTPWDRFLVGNDDELSDAQLRGAKSFMTIRCMRCHETDAFDDRDGEFHNVATPQLGPGKGDGPGGVDDFGREGVTGDPAERRMFKTPTMRNVELTSPYGHAGQFATLESIVEHYDEIDERLRDYDVTQVEAALRATLLDNFDDILVTRDTILLTIEFDEAGRDDLVAFLESLTDEAARTLTGIAPATVPSGLPIDN
ncbi:MAG: cytochrome-c peroxidase [Gemmatimonadetes bacterium]|nr:cytochrome-c peroxidase [Gemmatimonadota bacterium]